MFLAVWRTITIRVNPNALLVFMFYSNGSNQDASNVSGSFLPKLKASLTDNYSLFSWADKGQWETVPAGNNQINREGDWFRIGSEPMFVDYTKSGTWFVIISLLEVGSLGCVLHHGYAFRVVSHFFVATRCKRCKVSPISAR